MSEYKFDGPDCAGRPEDCGACGEQDDCELADDGSESRVGVPGWVHGLFWGFMAGMAAIAAIAFASV